MRIFQRHDWRRRHKVSLTGTRFFGKLSLRNCRAGTACGHDMDGSSPRQATIPGPWHSGGQMRANSKKRPAGNRQGASKNPRTVFSRHPVRLGRSLRMARQSVVNDEPGNLRRYPDMHFRMKRRRVVERRQRKAETGTVERFERQPRAALRTEVTPEPFRRAPARRRARDRDGGFRKGGDGKEWRPHRLLADAAMTDADAERRGIGAKADRAASAAAFIGWREIGGGVGAWVSSVLSWPFKPSRNTATTSGNRAAHGPRLSPFATSQLWEAGRRGDRYFDRNDGVKEKEW